VHRGKDIKFKDRSCLNKWERFIYKLLRISYVSLIFYFIPYFVWFLNIFIMQLDEMFGFLSIAKEEI